MNLGFGERFTLVQQLLELNSNATGIIPDSYRANSIDLIANMSDLLSG
jgi:hypothetical protein